MNKNTSKISSRIFFSLLITSFLFLYGHGFEFSPSDLHEKQEQEAKQAELYRDVHPLISDSDLYCSFFILGEDQRLEIKIVDAKKEKVRVILREHDIVYLNRGKVDGLKPDQLFLVIEVGPRIKNPVTKEKYGNLVFKRGRARITAIARDRASASLEKLCGEVKVGDFLIPFEEKAGLLGKDLGYDVSPPEEGVNGNFIYLQREYNQIGSGNWALIDLGEEDGIQFGQQLIAYRLSREAVALNIIANLVVIDTQKTTSTVKVLSCRDPIRLGDRVRTR